MNYAQFKCQVPFLYPCCITLLFVPIFSSFVNTMISSTNIIFAFMNWLPSMQFLKILLCLIIGIINSTEKGLSWECLFYFHLCNDLLSYSQLYFTVFHGFCDEVYNAISSKFIGTMPLAFGLSFYCIASYFRLVLTFFRIFWFIICRTSVLLFPETSLCSSGNNLRKSNVQ